MSNDLFYDNLSLVNAFLLANKKGQRGSAPHPPLPLHFKNSGKLLSKWIRTMALLREVPVQRRSEELLQGTTGRRK